MDHSIYIDGRDDYTKIHEIKQGTDFSIQPKQISLNPVGNHIISIIHGVNFNAESVPSKLEKILDRAIDLEEFNTLKTARASYQTQNGIGHSIAKIISESHIIATTCNGNKDVIVDITSCRSPESGNMAYDYILNNLAACLDRQSLIVYSITVPKDVRFAKDKSKVQQIGLNLAGSASHIFSMIYGVKDDIISDKDRLNDILTHALKSAGYEPLADSEADFDADEVSKAYTLVKIIGSHVVMSTYPEFGSIELDITTMDGHGLDKKIFDCIKKQLLAGSDSKNHGLRGAINRIGTKLNKLYHFPND